MERQREEQLRRLIFQEQLDIKTYREELEASKRRPGT
jgi:hypothetical protein